MSKPKREPLFLRRFWRWYERHYIVNVTIAGVLFTLQLIHLYWLTTDVVAFRLFGERYFDPTPLFRTLLILVDYTEIPAIISTSFVYLFELRKRHRWRMIWYLIFLNVQWLHLFWITDEFVVHQFALGEPDTILPLWLAWVAICIDYLELPVIADTLWRGYGLLRKMPPGEIMRQLRKQYVWRR
jgi:hypothetical protein